jgi:hypothetical protein
MSFLTIAPIEPHLRSGAVCAEDALQTGEASRVGGFLWKLASGARRRLRFRKAPAPPGAPWSAAERIALLRRACCALLNHQHDEVEAILALGAAQTTRDAPFLNLIGIAHEGRGHWKLARKFYGKAMRADRSYQPAEQNMRRLYELYTFGRSRVGVAVGYVADYGLPSLAERIS